jgi:hypothetical protein
MDINKVCKRFRSVKVLDISNISRACNTKQGEDLHRIGKVYISQEISKIICNGRKPQLKCNSFRRLKPGNLIKKTGSLRLQSLRSI